MVIGDGITMVVDDEDDKELTVLLATEPTSCRQLGESRGRHIIRVTRGIGWRSVVSVPPDLKMSFLSAAASSPSPLFSDFPTSSLSVIYVVI